MILKINNIEIEFTPEVGNNRHARILELVREALDYEQKYHEFKARGGNHTKYEDKFDYICSVIAGLVIVDKSALTLNVR